MKIGIKNTPKKGLGVFATKDIKKGEVIEICPLILISQDDFELISRTKLGLYVYDDAFNFNNSTYSSGGVVLALGYGSIYNHSRRPNADWRRTSTRTAEFFSTKDIKAGQEICVDYGEDYDYESFKEY